MAFRSPVERAHDAQVDFFRYLASDAPERSILREKLLSVFSTAEIAHRPSPIRFAEHKGFAETKKPEFDALEQKLWRLLQEEHSPLVVFATMLSTLFRSGFPITVQRIVLVAHDKA